MGETVEITEATESVAGNGKGVTTKCIGRFKLDKCGLEVEDGTKPTPDEWRYAGKRLSMPVGRPWHIGDWLRLGEDNEFISSQNYDHAEEILDLDHQTLKNFAYVARRVERTVRRYDLSWAHHQAVAAYTSEKQAKWLEKAAQSKWTSRQLRVKIAESKNPGYTPNSSTSADHIEREGANITIYDLRKYVPGLGDYLHTPDEYIVTKITSRKPKRGDAVTPDFIPRSGEDSTDQVMWPEDVQESADESGDE